ncbi:MAG: FecR family protein [Gammaproteobacteria bacterium]
MPSNHHQPIPQAAHDGAIEWHVRLSSGSVTPEVARAFRAWLAASPDHEAAWQRLQTVWQGLEPLRKTLEPKSPPRRLHPGRWGAAVALALALTCALLVFPPSWWRADYTTGVGEQRLVTLPDGSTVQLNTHTALALRDSAAIRGVEVLSGEAAFKVKSDPVRPFVVTSGEGAARAVGTAFVVTRDNDGTTVTVTEGVVEVRDRAGSALRVSRGEIARYDGRGGVRSVPNSEFENYTAWQNGQLIFRGASVREVVEQVNRYRRGQVAVLNEALAQQRVSGVFRLDALDTAIETIAETTRAETTHISPYLIFLH